MHQYLSHGHISALLGVWMIVRVILFLLLSWVEGEHKHCSFTFINGSPGWSVFYQEKEVEEMIEWGVFSKKPFFSQQALAEKSLVSKSITLEGLSGQNGFFFLSERAPEMLLTIFQFSSCGVFRLEWRMASFNGKMCWEKKLSTSCYLLIYHHSVTVLLCSFYRANLYVSVWLLGHPVGRTGKHWMKQCRMRETELITFSNIGDHWHHQITNVK